MIKRPLNARERHQQNLAMRDYQHRIQSNIIRAKIVLAVIGVALSGLSIYLMVAS